MTKQEYQQAVEAIDMKYREDRAALERVWILLNGSKAPDGIAEPGESDRVGLMNGEDLPGVIPGGSMKSGYVARGVRKSLKGLSADEKKARKAAYMKAYLAKRKAAKGN